ncbi:hypothetical protein KDW41_12470 [Burkholderia vietnamiensis]|nr:hypothetical protein [Burkholderia vietnamiensis]
MEIVNVNFSDGSKTEIVGYFNAKQDNSVWPNSDQIGVDDPRWAAYFNKQPDEVKPFLPPPVQE